MNYIVLDLEWNQPYSMKSMIRSPVYLQGEIIQIGAVKLDEQFNLMDTFKIMVTPKYYRFMHKKVSRLTSISNEDLKYGFPFKQAVGFFKAWCPKDSVFLTWGGDDGKMLRTNLKLHKLPTDWIPKIFDVQQIFGRQLAMEPRQYSLTQAMEVVQEPAYSAHDALHDAMNTTRVLRHLDMERGFTEYGAPRSCTQAETEGGYQDLVETTFASKPEAFDAAAQMNWKCPACGEIMTFGGWQRQNAEKRIAVATCACGEPYFARIRVRTDYNQFRVNRMVYPLTEELNAFYQEREEIEQAKEERRLQYAVQDCAC